MKQGVTAAKAPAAIGPYSQAIRAGGWLFLSGQLPLDAKGDMVAGGVAAQTERILSNLQAVLLEAGMDLGNVVKTTVYMTDLKEFGAMNEVYARHFAAPCPARATVQVAALPKGAAVEISAIAVAAG
ncbi:MAG: RidA family protein [Elusimicrobia bacterium]|nr:RidA family protein [Elusimicrobiota bacterium]